MEHPCEVLLLASSIYHIFAAFGLLVKEFRHIIPSPKLSTINDGSPPKIMDQRSRLAAKSHLAYLKGMTESCPVVPRTGKEYSLDFFAEELGHHSKLWIDLRNELLKVSTLSSVSSDDIEVTSQTLDSSSDEVKVMKAQVPSFPRYGVQATTATLKSPSVEISLLVPKVPHHQSSNHPQCFSLERMSDNKFKSLRKKMMRMKETMDEFGIFRELERRHDSIDALKTSYLACCAKFCQEKLPKATTKYQTYLVKCAAYTGIIIHDLLGVKQSNLLSVYQNVFAHVLEFSFKDSYLPNKSGNPTLSYEFFFGKLLPRSVFSGANIAAQKLLLFLRECFEVMELKPPDDHLLFYFEDKRFDNVRAKIHTNDDALVGAENIIEFSKSMKSLGCVSPTPLEAPDPADTNLGTLLHDCQSSGRTKSNLSRKGDQDDLQPLLSRTLFDSMSPVVPSSKVKATKRMVPMNPSASFETNTSNRVITEGEKIPSTKETSAKKKHTPTRKMQTPAKKMQTSAKNKQSEKRLESPLVSSRSPPQRSLSRTLIDSMIPVVPSSKAKGTKRMVQKNPSASFETSSSNRDITQHFLPESQPLLSRSSTGPSYQCDWHQAIPCTMTDLAPLPCQREGCEVLVHHICQSAWESREGHDDVVARYCRRHHPNYKGEKILFANETSAKKKHTPARKLETPAKKMRTSAKNKQSEKRRESPRVSSRSPPKRYRSET
jgi:hypothetical protein